MGADLKVIRNDELTVNEIKELNPEKIILSPGPSTPDEAGVCLEVIEKLADTTPILGICLGHQSIAQVFGGEVIRAPKMMHGKTSEIDVLCNDLIFKGLPKKLIETRYHSLTVNKNNLPSTIQVTSKSLDDDEIMSIKIKDKNVFGVQFHPESVMSEYGHEMLDNFLKL